MLTGVAALTEINKAQYETDLANAKDLFDKKLIGENEYNNRVKEIKRKQAEADKGAAVFNIFLSTAQAIAKASPNLALIALAAALGAVQTAAVLAKPLPAFKTGKVGINGPGTTTSDSILARISKGESIINADMTLKHREALEAINSNKFQDYLNNFIAPRIKQFYEPIRITPIQAGQRHSATHNTPTEKLDYDKLGRSLAKHMPKQAGTSVTIDRNGIIAITKDGLSREIILNRKSKR